MQITAKTVTALLGAGGDLHTICHVIQIEGCVPGDWTRHDGNSLSVSLLERLANSENESDIGLLCTVERAIFQISLATKTD